MNRFSLQIPLTPQGASLLILQWVLGQGFISSFSPWLYLVVSADYVLGGWLIHRVFLCASRVFRFSLLCRLFGDPFDTLYSFRLPAFIFGFICCAGHIGSRRRPVSEREPRTVGNRSGRDDKAVVLDRPGDMDGSGYPPVGRSFRI